MKVGDKVMVNPKLTGQVAGIPIKEVQGKVMTIRKFCGAIGVYLKESGYIYIINMLIPADNTLLLLIHERKQYEI